PFLLPPAVVADVHLAADQGLDAAPATVSVELDRSGERAVVGEPDGRHLEFGRAADELRDAARPVQDRVLGVDVQMDEGRCGHGQGDCTRRSGPRRRPLRDTVVYALPVFRRLIPLALVFLAAGCGGGGGAPKQQAASGTWPPSLFDYDTKAPLQFR